MLDPAKPFSSRRSRDTTAVATAKADLTGLLDRARDERFRLLKMLKDARTEVAVTLQNLPPADERAESTAAAEASQPPAAARDQASLPRVVVDPERTPALVAKLTELNEQLDEKLRRVNRLADEKIARLETVEARIAHVIQRFDDAQATAEQRMSDKVDAHQQRLADLTDAADRELQSQSQRLDEAVAGLTELFERQADHLIADLRARAAAVLDNAKANADRRAA